MRSTLWPYFRPRVIGAEHLPKGRALIVGCHSGVIPYDAACTLVAIHDATGRFSRAIGDNLFGQIGVVQDFLRRQGAVVGRPEVVEQLLRAGQYVLVFPGGARDMERPYLTQRYRVLPHRGFAPGHGGYIKIALRTRSPIVPLAVVGAEEAHVMLASLPPVARVLGVPLFPLLLFPCAATGEALHPLRDADRPSGHAGGCQGSAESGSAQSDGAAACAATHRRHGPPATRYHLEHL